ncbi:TetR/AcrR family transcriptional regulator [Saccharopolyspora spinosporotrichia]
MPRDTLTADQIVRAAIALLDDEGLDGLNMRSLGKRLGVAATAIYWHIATKEQLVQLAGDAIWDEVELPDPDSADWRSAATAVATSTHAMLVRHPGSGRRSAAICSPGRRRPAATSTPSPSTRRPVSPPTTPTARRPPC